MIPPESSLQFMDYGEVVDKSTYGGFQGEKWSADGQGVVVGAVGEEQGGQATQM